jgi:hypothetical protein
VVLHRHQYRTPILGSSRSKCLWCPTSGVRHGSGPRVSPTPTTDTTAAHQATRRRRRGTAGSRTSSRIAQDAAAVMVYPDGKE